MNAELEAARCSHNSDIYGNLNKRIRLRTRLRTVGMTLDDTVFSGMLVSSLPEGERFDRFCGHVESRLDCVNTSKIMSGCQLLTTRLIKLTNVVTSIQKLKSGNTIKITKQVKQWRH